MHRTLLITATLVLCTAMAAPSNAASQASEPASAKSTASKSSALTDPKTILQRMKAALEPNRPRVAKIQVVLHSPDGFETQWEGWEARKRFPDGNRLLLAMTQPADIAGSALLIWERPKEADIVWNYLPGIRRVRKIVPVGSFQPFLGTDFTYSDLGFIDLSDRTLKLLGREKHADVDAYKLEEIPSQQWYYSHVIDWISAKTLLPIQRDFYSPGKMLWKSEYFDSVKEIDGTPTATEIRIEDHMNGGFTAFRLTAVRYDADVPNDLFESQNLPKASLSPLWK